MLISIPTDSGHQSFPLFPSAATEVDRAHPIGTSARGPSIRAGRTRAARGGEPAILVRAGEDDGFARVRLGV